MGSGFLSLFPSSPLAHLAESRGWGSEVRGQTDLLPWLLTAALWATNAEGHTPLQAVSEASWRSPARPSGLGDASPLLTKAHFNPQLSEDPLLTPILTDGVHWPSPALLLDLKWTLGPAGWLSLPCGPGSVRTVMPMDRREHSYFSNTALHSLCPVTSPFCFLRHESGTNRWCLSTPRNTNQAL